MKSEISTFLTVGIIILYSFQTQVLAKKLKFCLVNGEKTKKLISFKCPNLNNLECVIAFDRISCLRLLVSNKADFMTAEPEDLRVIGMTEHYNNEILVTHELRIWENERSSYQLVTIIRKSVRDVWHIAKKRFCSSGLEPSLFALNYLKYFENQLVLPRCNSTKTLLENRLSDLSQFFESSCISGPWTSDPEFDNKLKRKYRNLCSQCENPDSCSLENKYFGEEEVLLCLTDGDGDIAWSRLDYVHQHFKELHDGNEYYFLCLNSSLRNLTDPDPCVWLEIPWKTVIARKDIADEVKKFINYEINGVDDSLSLLQEDIRRVPVNVEFFRTPNDYLRTMFPEFYAFKDHLQCKENSRVVKWCVVSNLEFQKCELIAKVANSYGIEPLIKCVQKSSRENCIKSVQNKESDIFSAEPQEDLETRKKGLKPILHMVSKIDGYENKIISVVKKFSNFYTLQDVKNHKACFTGFRDAGWNTFLFTMKNLTGDSNWYCRDKEMVSEFFSKIFIANLRNKTNSTFPANFVSLHSSTNENEDKVALNCLNFEGGDVAFVNLSTIEHYYPGSLENIYRPLCINTTNSGKVEKCFSNWRIQGTLMVNGKISKVRMDEIYLMLVDLDKLFKGHFQGATPLLSLYGPFEEEKNIIFPEQTEHLEKDVGGFPSSLSYNEILEDLTGHMQKCSSANPLKQKLYLVIFAYFLYFCSKFLWI